MGAGTFPIQNPTIGGGTAFNDIVAQLLATLSGDRFGRASIGTDLFSQILGAETAARRRPVGIIDQLLLANEFGSVMPLSQIGGGRLAALGGRTSSSLGELFKTLTQFAGGANAPDPAPVATAPAPTSAPRPTAQELLQQSAGLIPGEGTAKDALLQMQRDAGLLPLQMAHGGTLTVDPRRKKTQGTSLAGPATVVDRQGQAAAVIGEGRSPESVTVSPATIGGPPTTAPTGPAFGPGFVPRGLPSNPPAGGFAPDATGDLFGLLGQPRDVTFRLQEILRLAGGFGSYGNLDPARALAIAQRPGDFEAFTGQESDPKAVASRLLGGAITADQRFQNPLVKALALGRAPTSAQITGREFADLPPDLRDALIGIIGEDQLPGFLFAVQQGTPTGRSGIGFQQAGGVRV